MHNNRFDDYYAIIPHPTDHSILLLKDEDGWTLPKATVLLSPDDGRWRDAFRVNAAFYQLLGIKVTVLECLFVSPFPGVGQHGGSLFAMSNDDTAWTLPPTGAWIAYEQMNAYPLAIPEHPALLEQWLTRTKSSPNHGLPWTRDGWFEEASAWIEAQLSRHGLTATGPIEQMRSWFISSLLRVPTSGGEVYFKAVPPTDVHESLLTQMLATRYPTLVPHVLAVHVEQRWLLMKAVAGQKVPQEANQLDYLERWKTLLRTYASMQRDYSKYTEQLLALDCHDWRLETLAEQTAPLFAELPSLLQGAQHPLTVAEQQSLHSLVPRMKTCCVELAQLGIPPSLHHGDFHRGNIIVNETTCTLIDWAGFVGVTHPFLSLWVPLNDWEPDLGQQLCDTYLEAWSDIAPREQLHAAITLAHPLAALCGVLGHRHQMLHARTALVWDILGEQEHMLECLRSIITLMDQV